MEQRYYSGEEIHIGDRVKYGGQPATVVFVIDREEWPADESVESRSWWRAEHRSGFMFISDTGARFLLPDPDEDLDFVGRRANVG